MNNNYIICLHICNKLNGLEVEGFNLLKICLILLKKKQISFEIESNNTVLVMG